MTKRGSRGYGQFCGLARALDVVGDRWTLLIVRELLIGPRRFGELRKGLCGIATNLLSQRLRQLEADGILERSLGTPEEGTRYALTARGAALRPVIEQLVRWSGPLMASGAQDDEFRPEWLAVALPAVLPPRPGKPAVVGLETGGTHLVLETGPNGSTVRLGAETACEATISAKPEVILGLASGGLTVHAAVRSGARLTGNRKALARVFGGHHRATLTAGRRKGGRSA